MAYILSDRKIYLAIPEDTYQEFGEEPIVKRVFAEYKFKILIYEPITQLITSWID